MKKFIKCISTFLLSLIIAFSGACECDMSGGLFDAAYFYCINKLENVDLTFNFDGGQSGGARLASLNTANSGDLVYTCEQGDYYYDEGWRTYFGSQTSELVDLSSQARMRIDELTQTVTVLNKLVVFDGVTARYIGYDEENDVVTGFIGYVYNDYIQDKDEGIDSDVIMGGIGSTDGGEYVDPYAGLPKDTLTGAIYVKIYDDEDGIEVVEFSHFEYAGKAYDGSDRGSYLYTYIKNVPTKEYIIERSTLYTNLGSLDVLENQGTSSIFRAVKQDGKFIGSKVEFDYSKTNPLVNGEAFVELNGGYYILNLVDETYRSFNINFGYFDFSDEAETNSEMYLGLTMLEGWDSIVHYVEDKNNDTVIDQTDYDLTIQGSFDVSGNDYILLDNGKKIQAGMLWSKEDGFITLHNAGSFVDETYYTKEDGTVIPYSEFPEYVNNADYEFLSIDWIPITPFYMPDNADSGKLLSGGIMVSLYSYFDGDSTSGGVSGGSDQADTQTQSPMSLAFEFMKENGLTFGDFDAGELYAYNLTAKAERNTMIQNQFKSAFNYDFDSQGINALKDSIIQNTKDFVSNCRTIYSTYDRMLRKNMPKLEEGAGLINLENSAKGTFTVTDGKLDFSGVSITVPKNILLQKGETYGFKVYLEGTKQYELDGAFNSFTYDKKETTLTGNSQIVIPDVIEGEYILKAVFGKIKNDNFMELSGLILFECGDFTSIQKTATVDGNNFDITIENLGGRFMITSVLNNGGQNQ